MGARNLAGGTSCKSFDGKFNSYEELIQTYITCLTEENMRDMRRSVSGELQWNPKADLGDLIIEEKFEHYDKAAKGPAEIRAYVYSGKLVALQNWFTWSLPNTDYTGKQDVKWKPKVSDLGFLLAPGAAVMLLDPSTGEWTAPFVTDRKNRSSFSAEFDPNIRSEFAKYYLTTFEEQLLDMNRKSKMLSAMKDNLTKIQKIVEHEQFQKFTEGFACVRVDFFVNNNKHRVFQR